MSAGNRKHTYRFEPMTAAAPRRRHPFLTLMIVMFIVVAIMSFGANKALADDDLRKCDEVPGECQGFPIDRLGRCLRVNDEYAQIVAGKDEEISALRTTNDGLTNDLIASQGQIDGLNDKIVRLENKVWYKDQVIKDLRKKIKELRR